MRPHGYKYSESDINFEAIMVIKIYACGTQYSTGCSSIAPGKNNFHVSHHHHYDYNFYRLKVQRELLLIICTTETTTTVSKDEL